MKPPIRSCVTMSPTRNSTEDVRAMQTEFAAEATLRDRVGNAFNVIEGKLAGQPAVLQGIRGIKSAMEAARKDSVPGQTDVNQLIAVSTAARPAAGWAVQVRGRLTVPGDGAIDFDGVLTTLHDAG
jgi:hypothetical protein